MKKFCAIVLILILSFTAALPVTGAEQAKNSENSTNINDEYIIDKDTGIVAEIVKETLTDKEFALLRNYYNDQTLTNESLFKRLIDLKKSYINALESLYNTNYLSTGDNSYETSVRIYFDGQQTLFGQDSSVYLYNIAVYERLKFSEITYLDIIVPVGEFNSIITINIAIPRDKLGEQAIGKVASILSDIRHDGLSPQLEAPGVLSDSSVIQSAKSGIYPAASQENPNYVSYEDAFAGYSLLLPDSYAQFIHNNLGGEFTYSSFKLNPNQFFSISSEPLTEANDSISAAIERFEKTSLESVEILHSASVILGENEYAHIRYSNDKNESCNGEETFLKYFYDYYIQSGKRLYKLQLQSNIIQADSIITLQLEKILESFSTGDTIEGVAEEASDKAADEADDRDKATNDAEDKDKSGDKDESGDKDKADKEILVRDTDKTLDIDFTTTLYENREEGYSFEYPDAWSLEDVSPDLNYDHLNLDIPGLSGALEITFQESEMKCATNCGDIIKSVEGNSISCWSDLTVGYHPPFCGKVSRLLFFDFIENESSSTIYRLGAFSDDNGRNRLCYSVDILRDTKIYSMFITAGEYRTKSGYFDDEKTNQMINHVASSFRIDETPESKARALLGETRNRKLVFAEEYLKQRYSPSLEVLDTEKTQPDGTTLVRAGNSSFSGYYNIRLDYAAREIEVIERLLDRDIMFNQISFLRDHYRDKGMTIAGIRRNEADMTIAIEAFDGERPTKFVRNYQISVDASDGEVKWKTTRTASQQDYINECRFFLGSFISPETGVYIFGKDVFKDIDTYSHKGLDYRLLAYYQTINRSGFFVLSMDPLTGLFHKERSYIPLTYIVGNVKSQFDIETTDFSSSSYSFDPETFTLSLYSKDGAGRADTEHFRIHYNPEINEIQYRRINLP